jgi:hypothetical protein
VLAALAAWLPALGASALSIAPGSFIGVWIKNGAELIVSYSNVAPPNPLQPPFGGDAYNPPTINLTIPPQGPLPPEFGGSLLGAKFVGFGRRAPNDEFLPGFARENFFYTTNALPAPDFFETGNAATQIESWLSQIASLGTSTRVAMSTGAVNSYTSQLQSLGQDKLANSVPFSLATDIASLSNSSIGLWETTQTFNGSSIGSLTRQLGTLVNIPEPSTALLLLLGLGGLGVGGRKRRA